MGSIHYTTLPFTIFICYFNDDFAFQVLNNVRKNFLLKVFKFRAWFEHVLYIDEEENNQMRGEDENEEENSEDLESQ